MTAALALDRVLRLLAEEAEGISVLASRAMGALGLALGDVAPAPDLLRDAQALDELEQRLAGLRSYLDALARTAPGGVTLDVSGAVAGLALSAQADRLSGRGARAAGGTIELF